MNRPNFTRQRFFRRNFNRDDYRKRQDKPHEAIEDVVNLLNLDDDLPQTEGDKNRYLTAAIAQIMDDYARHTAEMAADTIQPQVTSLCGNVTYGKDDKDHPRDGFPPAVFPAHCMPQCLHLQGPQEPREQRMGTDPDGRSPNHGGQTLGS
jgi:hypothetical protein